MEFQALLLCAGKSSRMWPLSDKIFFEYLGKTVLDHQVEMLLGLPGLSRIHIVGNRENSAQLKEVLQKNYPRHFSNFLFSLQEDISGMRGGVLAAAPQVSLKMPLFIMSSNDFVEKSLPLKVLKQAQKSSSDIFLCGKRVDKYFPGGYLLLDSEKRAQKIWEKPGEGNEPSNLVNLVLHLFKHPALLIKELQSKHHGKLSQNGYEQALQNLLDQQIKAEVVEYDGFWQALKYPWHHLDLMQYFLGKKLAPFIHSKASVSPQAVISGDVSISEGVKILDFAVIQGPVYIGKNSIIGNHSLVRASHVGEGCVIGSTTEITRSYLRKNIWTHQNYIGDSVLDENISFGAGARAANLRLDEQEIVVTVQKKKVLSGKKKLGLICGKDVRCGINVSFLPGKKVGAKSFIGAGIIVGEDVEEGVFISGKPLLRRKKNRQVVLKRSL